MSLDRVRSAVKTSAKGPSTSSSLTSMMPKIASSSSGTFLKASPPSPEENEPASRNGA